MNLDQATPLGFDGNRLGHLGNVINRDIDARRYDGAVLAVARGGKPVLTEAFGYAHRDSERRMKKDDVFVSFSIAKQLTHTLVLNRVERGELALTQRVADVIPEFANRGKENITLFHVLTHTAGLTLKLPMMDPMQVGNLEAVVQAACMSAVESVPGERVYYSGIIGTAILAEVLRRVDGGKRAYRDILAQDLFAPLGMKDSALGARADLASRLCPVVARDRLPGLSFAEEYEMFGAMVTAEAEIPALGCVLTAPDLTRFANMLRGGGAFDGERILSPAMVDLATRNHTGQMPNDTWSFASGVRGWKPFPAYLGLGFYLRGDVVAPNFLGTLTSPRSYGGAGAGSTMFWVDPERDLTCVFLSSGLITCELRNIDRLQRISDLVVSALVD
ncbi:serine hydrolase domain-containing protein [Piscinibacter sp.]|uniref:serine hydrolase domain-containing protein n=1 Tax=Piscinibacter sp. TaxID=1903157 RepID=UPI002F42D1BB